ncbi:hypothetical protein [Aquimarina celericrescens]|uniref:Uncharacterized protein n=1 Tax=Aquimarina celericrescens TaxID=1964542 RepID=A0ABW5ASM8_9FLAO|nr:hypothetical protein [Aquimarina celericrescens]
MKNFGNLKTMASLIIGVFFIVSCEKSDVEIETNQILETEKEEGFKSKTGNDGEALNNTKEESVLPVMKMHFGKDVSKEEAMRKFDAAVKTYISKQPVQTKAFSTEWYYKVWTFTGTQSNNDTDGDVGTYVRFTTSAGAYTSNFNWMDEFWDDDFEGGWDAFLFKSSFPGRAVEWVEVDNATLYLEGTDGWFVTDFVIQMAPDYQTLPATGFSSFWAHPNVWLDNSCSNSCWDSYYTGNIGTGRLNF